MLSDFYVLIAILFLLVGGFKFEEYKLVRYNSLKKQAIICFIVGIALILVSIKLVHAFGSNLPTPTPVPSPTATPSPEPSIIPKDGIGFKCKSCTKAEEQKLQKAQKVANEVVHSDCFKMFLLSWGMIETKGKSPLQVVKHIQFAELEVPVHYYYDASLNKAIGYRQPPYPDIYFNRFYHDYYNECDTASNAVHEWSHVLGYTHPFKPTPTRGRTVPYSINLAFEKCCKISHGYRGH